MNKLFRGGIAFIFCALTMVTACNEKKLPYLGPDQVVTKKVNGEKVTDTVPHKIPEFRFIDQKGEKISEKTFEGKVYVADFFFTNCPTICPDMTEQMHRVYKKYQNNENVMFLSHTVDPKRDTPQTLKNYADKLGVSSDKWKFATGDKDSIYHVGREGYMASARKDSTAPGGFLHSGQFFLIDQKRRIRGIYNGTKPKSVDQLMKDIAILLN